MNCLFHNVAFLTLSQCKVLGYVRIFKGLMLVLITTKLMAVLQPMSLIIGYISSQTCQLKTKLSNS